MDNGNKPADLTCSVTGLLGELDSTRTARWPLQQCEAAVAVYRYLDEWTRARPDIKLSRSSAALPWSSLLAAYTFAGAFNQTVREFAAQCLTLFMYDDIIDDESGIFTETALQDLTDACLGVTKLSAVPEARTPTPSNVIPDQRGSAKGDSGALDNDGASASATGRLSAVEQTISCFADCMGGAVRRAQSAKCAEIFVDVLAKTLRSHLVNRNLRANDESTPTLDQHLANGSYAVGTPILLLSAMMTNTPHDIDPIEVDRYRSCCLDLGWCVRVSNDIANLDDDMHAGQVNTVTLLVEEQHVDELRAIQNLLSEVRGKIAHMHRVADDPGHPLSQHYRWLARCADFHVDWYMTRATYSFTTEDWVTFGQVDDHFGKAVRAAIRQGNGYDERIHTT
ncbi:terpene synthase family protein [Saccharopolyspora phatthalungensis]|uniref:Terpene synthase metal-binding domain-containing protein n=1 Tax=Saccharopolyspora phatthalungensis TaxID=664693 RepID=A0A840QJ39_9PSEU|nr:hypothetical protein [Saccharopolyspora phatthalungensis]MBB5159018.1 hypothetical protein [Saccharopolyspora phatthalungensis]